ncbi:uncharacterized protein PAC_05377 [Phialocephala subalpina]|uniref:RNase III domain-containing protein n=1 Tax=Phialocephala subalpina TaxID=576137 RepID=A0A1L7WRV2_9HELO|nr:uncharacterized protein PAC_05377 [Phialocephala subalpina]
MQFQICQVTLVSLRPEEIELVRQRKKIELPRGVDYRPPPIPADMNPDDWLAEVVEALCITSTIMTCSWRRWKVQNRFYRLPEVDEAEHEEHAKTIKKKNLVAVGQESKIQRWIRPRRGLAPSNQQNPLALIRRDISDTFGGHYGPRAIERAMEALIGAVYYDGGIEAVKKVMMELRPLIRKAEKNTEEPILEKHAYH